MADVIAAAPERRILVIAGAGVGKTHVLCRRVAALVEGRGLSPGREIVILSFTQAAVGEIGLRLRDESPVVRAVRPVTFDALASRLLAATQESDDWIDLDFDARVERARRCLNEPVGTEHLADVRHVFVDEAQDLVEVRAEFASSLLTRLDCGYTVLGDPAQAIYGFSDGGSGENLISRLPDLDNSRRASVIRLEGNRRAVTSGARAGLWAGPLISAGETPSPELHSRLLDTVRDLPDLGAIEEAGPMLAASRVSTAVLCRTNGEVLWISERLTEMSVPHAVQRAAEDRPISSWIAGVFNGWQRSVMARAAFEERVAPLRGAPQPDVAWQAVNGLAGRDRETVDIDILRHRLRHRRVPQELTPTHIESLVVSTVHRAKGLGFDRVLILEPRIGHPEEDLGEEARVLYVALTRARTDLFLLRRGTMPTMGRHRGRWTRQPGRPGSVEAFEVGRHDVAHDVPYASDGAPAAGHVQENLKDQERAEVCLRLWENQTRNDVPLYTAWAEDGPLGTTHETLGFYICEALGRDDPASWPPTLRGARVDMVETVLGAPLTSESAGLGGSGMWLAPRLVGLVRPDPPVRDTR